MSRAWLTRCLLMLVAFAACGPGVEVVDDAGLLPGDAAVDAGGLEDAGLDAGAPDAGRVDAGSDAGEADAGSVDGGGDAGARDDAGLDAGGSDGGGLDAGADAGTADAGFDAGVNLEVDAGPPNAVVTIDVATPGLTVPDDFLGLSVEWNHVPDYLGDNAGQPRATVTQLLNHFASDGHHPVLRIGGNSEDKAYWNPNAQPLPSGATVSIEPTHLSILSALHAATGSTFILGLNLQRSDPPNAAALVTASLSALGSGAITAFELGNEPDLYALNGVRPLWYSMPFYQSDFNGYFPALSTAASNQPRFAAPAVYGTSWLGSLGGFLAAEQGRVGLVTVHRYPFNVCLGMTGAPTIPSLFTATATTGYATTFAPTMPTVTQAGLKLRVAEMNSISCGGVTGVSDVFAAGLWGVDAMFQLASIGAAGVNLHTGARYAVFDFDSAGALQVRGLYYAMLLFSRATAHQGRLLPVTVTSALQVRAWATLGSDGVTRVALVNEDLSQAAEVRLAIPSRTSVASQWLLRAPTLDATTNIMFGAQTFQGSVDGLPSGSAGGELVNTQAGAYRLTLQPGSAALVVVP